MKKRITSFIDNNKQLLVTMSFVIIIGIIGIIIYFTMTNNLDTKNYINDYYSFSYDKSWFITERNNNNITLKHENSMVKIKIVELTNQSLDSILDKTLWVINEDNSSYKLISKYKTSITMNNYEGYRLLYENDQNQTLVILGKKGNKLMIANYTAKNDSFDILFDSANYIINSFTILNETFSLEKDIDLKLSSIKWNDNSDLNIDEDDTNTYEINNDKYSMKYTLSTSFNSTDNSHNYSLVGLKNGIITAKIEIKNINVYEYLDKDNPNSIYFQMEKYEKEDDKYEKFKSQISRIESLSDNYIYKASWNDTSNNIYEEVQVIYSIDKNNIFVASIYSTNAYIPKELSYGIKNVK